MFIVDQVEIFGHAEDFNVYFCPLNCLAPDLLDRPTLTMLPDIQEHFFPHYFTDEQRSCATATIRARPLGHDTADYLAVFATDHL